ncbi:MAG: Maf family nucleotide pyrophosphatase [Oligosphaeraceae bacterium]
MLESQFRELLSRLKYFFERSQEDMYVEYAPVEMTVAVTELPVPWRERLSLPGHRPVKEGEVWGKDWESGWFHLTGRIPEHWAGKEGVLRLNLGGECLIFDGEGNPLCGLTNTSVYHPGTTKEVFYLASPLKGGETIDLWVEAAANNILGPADFDWNPHATRATHPQGRSTGVVRCARLALWNRELHLFRLQFWQLCYYLEYLGNNVKDYRCRMLAHAMGKALDAYRGDPSRAGEALKVLEPVWALHARGSAPRATAIGHAHIDVGWLWPVRESVRKAARTFSSQLRLMERHPEYRFGASQPQLYQFIKDQYPGLYARIVQAVREGRWECQGGMWVEADNNLPSGESLIRQFLHGKNFFRDEFGVEVRNLWLPDVFGYNGNTPQIMRICGCDFFLTQKLSWNTVNKPLYSTFQWQGIDGSRVVTHFPPENDYNALLAASQLCRAQDRLQESAQFPEFLSLFGLGDGGGGPSEDYVLRGKMLQDWEGSPRVSFGFAQPLFDRMLDQRKELPLWLGELYFENHRGTLTTQARTKRNNRKVEERLGQTEALCSLLPPSAYPRKELDKICKTLLLNQFHDIIPGSSIDQVYHRTQQEHAQCLEELARLLQTAGHALLAPRKEAVTFFNALSTPYRRALRIPREAAARSGSWQDLQGNPVPVQREASGALVARATVPSWGFLTLLSQESGPAPSTLQDQELVLENSEMCYRFDAQGRVLSARDRRTGEEYLAAPGNAFHLYHDETAIYDAWNVDPWYRGEEIPWEPAILRPAFRETGPVRDVLHFSLGFQDSSLELEVSLEKGSRRLEFQAKIQWHENHKMLRVAFPTTVRSPKAAFQIQYGVMERATHDNTSWEQVQFEVCAHKFADLSQPEMGVALLNDGKYGHSVKGAEMELNLLRSPKWPDFQADQGEQEVTYALLPHAGTWEDAPVYQEAAQLNRDPWPFPGLSAQGLSLPVSVEGEGVSWEVLKRAEKSADWILRIVETRGRHARGVLRLADSLKACRPVVMDAMEWEEGAPLEGTPEAGYAFALAPFQILTLCLPSTASLPEIVLASASPRRKELLAGHGVSFVADPAEGEEGAWDGRTPPGEYARRLSCQKAVEVSRRHPGKLTLGADTVVALEERLLGKPGTLEEAVEMLKSLSGRSHLVLTGVTLARDGEALRSWQVATRVRFRSLDETAIRHYLSLIQPLDKAGGYAIQDHGDQVVEEIQGLFSNVMGLPVEQILPVLRALQSPLP